MHQPFEWFLRVLNFFMWVRYRLALTAKRNCLGDLRRHSSNVLRGGNW